MSCCQRKAIPFQPRLLYMSFKADLKARMQCHSFEHYYRCRRCCDRCNAIQLFTSQHHPFTYKNTSKTAPYASTCKDHDDYINSTKQVSAWACVPGWQFETVSFDMMHLVFLGTAKNHIPSCLKILKLWGYYYDVGDSDDAFLKIASFEMKQDCKEHKQLATKSVVF